MKRIHIGNDFRVRWELTQLGEAFDLVGKTYDIEVSSPYGVIIVTDVVAEGNILSFSIPASQQVYLGSYNITLTIASETGQSWRLQQCDAFCLISCECGCDADVTTVVQLSSGIVYPANGLSAYEIAVINGYKGTYEEWVKWYATPQIEGATDNAELNKYVTEIMNATGFPTRVLLGLMLGGDITGYEERIENFTVTDAPACTFDYVVGFDDPETGEHIQMVETITSEIGTIVYDVISFLGLSGQMWVPTYFYLTIGNFKTQTTPLSGNINSDRQIAAYCPGIVNILISENVNVAKTTANNAQTTADNAQTTADNAQTTADNAQTTADNAQTTADNAQTTADEAKSIAQTYNPSGVTDNAEINKYIRQMYIDGNNAIQLGTFIKKIEILSLDYIADSADESNGLTITYRTNDSYTASRRIVRSTVQKYGFIVPLFRVYRGSSVNSIYIEFTLFVDIPDITTSFSYTPETPALVDMRRCGMPIGNEVAYIARKGYMTPDEVEDAIAKALASQS